MLTLKPTEERPLELFLLYAPGDLCRSADQSAATKYEGQVPLQAFTAAVYKAALLSRATTSVQHLAGSKAEPMALATGRAGRGKLLQFADC